MPSFTEKLKNLFVKDQSHGQRKRNKSKRRTNIFGNIFTHFAQKQEQNICASHGTYPVIPTNNTETSFSRQDDQDSLGYTQNQWDEQTINFELQDRMLDCLQNQRHVQQYRQSLISTLKRKKSSKASGQYSDQLKESKQTEKKTEQQTITPKLNKQQAKNLQQSRENNQQNNPFKTKNKESQTNKNRKNRFQKYKKLSQEGPKNQISNNDKNNDILEQIFGKDSKQLINNSLHGSDYIDHVLNLKFSNKQKSRQKNIQTSKNQIQQTKENISTQAQENVPIIHNKISQVSEANSLQITEEKNQLKLNQLSSSKESQRNLVKNTSKHDQAVITEQVQQQQKSQVSTNKSDEKENRQNKTQQNKHQIPFQVFSRSPKRLQSTKNIQQSQNSIQISSIPISSPSKSPYNYEKSKKLPIIYSPTQNNSKQHVQNTNFNKAQNVIKFNYSPYKSNQKENFNFQRNNNRSKSPRPVVKFNYSTDPHIVSDRYQSPQKPNSVKVNFNNNLPQPNKTLVYRIYSQPQNEERMPIFLQRLRRINSFYPNLYLAKPLDQHKIINDLRLILSAMKSAISVLELLYMKLNIRRNQLKELINKIIHSLQIDPNNEAYAKQLYQQQILEIFLNSGWQNNKIEEIYYIRPKERYGKRLLIPINFEKAIKNFNQNVNHYLNNMEMDLKTQAGKQRYLRIRQKISLIEKNIKMMSEDLYTYWLIECNYPFIYGDYLRFLKKYKQQRFDQDFKDQILARVLEGQDYNDPVSLSIIGRKIKQIVNN